MATKRITVLPGQSIWDLAIIHYGHVDGVKQLILDNPATCNFSGDITPGTELVISQDPINKLVVEFFEQQPLKPATAVKQGYIWWNDDEDWNDELNWTE